jgi:hypothetical protein
MAQVAKMPAKTVRRTRAPLEDPPDSPRGTAQYIAAMAGELAALAGRQKFDSLAYIFNLARQEAESIAGRSDDAESDS